MAFVYLSIILRLYKQSIMTPNLLWLRTPFLLNLKTTFYFHFYQSLDFSAYSITCFIGLHFGTFNFIVILMFGTYFSDKYIVYYLMIWFNMLNGFDSKTHSIISKHIELRHRSMYNVYITKQSYYICLNLYLLRFVYTTNKTSGV